MLSCLPFSPTRLFETNDASCTITSDPDWMCYRSSLAMRNGRLWVVAGDEANEGGKHLPALMFKCEQSAVGTLRTRCYCVSGCGHANVIAGAVVGMIFTAKQPICGVTRCLGTESAWCNVYSSVLRFTWRQIFTVISVIFHLVQIHLFKARHTV